MSLTFLEAKKKRGGGGAGREARIKNNGMNVFVKYSVREIK